MEITLKIDGKEKQFNQQKVNFVTMRKALSWFEDFQKSAEVLKEYIDSGIDGEPDEEILNNFQKKDEYEQLKETAELIVSYFDNQFSFDELINGLYVNTISEFHSIGYEIVSEVMMLMDENNEVTKKKS